MAGGSGGHSEPLSKGFRWQSPLRKFLGSKEHLDWLKIGLNMAEIFTIRDYKRTSVARVTYLSMRIQPKSCRIFPLKVPATFRNGAVGA